MARVLVANYCNYMDFECELEDPSVRDSGLEGMASPQVHGTVCVASKPPGWWVEELKREAETDPYMEQDDEELGGLFPAEEFRRWETEGWVDKGNSEESRPHQVFYLVTGQGEKEQTLACLVIQAVELAKMPSE